MSSTKVTDISAHRASLARRAPLYAVPTKRLVRPNQPLTQWLQWLGNAGVVVGLLYVLTLQRTGGFDEHYRVLAVASVLLMVIVYHTLGVYRRYSNQWSAMARVAQVWLITCAVIVLLGFLTKTSHHYSRQVVLSWFAAALVAQCGMHLLFHLVSRLWQVSLKVNLPAVVVGSGSLARHLVSSINRNVFLADHVVGVVDDPHALKDWRYDGVAALGGIDDLPRILESRIIDRVYIALPVERSTEVARLHEQLMPYNVDLIWVPDIFSLHLLNPSVRELAGVPLISLSESPLTSGGRAYLKSLMDVTGALLGIILLSPVMLAAAIAIKLTSPGPALYRQVRTGWDGSHFQIWKFRTMYVHDEGPGTLTQAQKDDKRVTPVGRFLRRTSIDELPQLFNVLSGSMSLVGPRPHSIIHDHEYSKHIDAYMARHRIKPGMTGWAQIHGYRGQTRTVEEMRRRVEYDVDYINRWSLKLDLWILLRTPFVLFSDKAY
ncbi:MAG TPA: undecaprenyl-phosphate glucose phosphotransferase [Pseudomonadales bacterium]